MPQHGAALINVMTKDPAAGGISACAEAARARGPAAAGLR
jgi:hypothetical protein